MPSASRRNSGFTLIELMVTLSVVLILAMLALPSFNSFRQRSALRGASEQALSFWNQARFEAAKRNALVKVSVKSDSTGFCLGATTLETDPSDPNYDVPCDCFTANVCNVAAFPSNQAEWREVSFVTTSGTTPTLGGADKSFAVIEPKRAGLADPAQAGLLTFAGPTGRKSYKLNLAIDQFGRAVLCESTSAPDKMSDYGNRSCAP